MIWQYFHLNYGLNWTIPINNELCLRKFMQDGWDCSCEWLQYNCTVAIHVLQVLLGKWMVKQNSFCSLWNFLWYNCMFFTRDFNRIDRFNWFCVRHALCNSGIKEQTYQKIDNFNDVIHQPTQSAALISSYYIKISFHWRF